MTTKNCRPSNAIVPPTVGSGKTRTRQPCFPAEMDAGFQPFPLNGALTANLNPTLRSLKLQLSGQTGEIYCYVIDTVDCEQHSFIHRGTGPNFQGGLITLCTCKHLMRSGRAPAAWRGQWVAGFTGMNKVDGDPRNYLVYLMRISEALSSHAELWKALPAATRRGKDATAHPFGDVYRPRASAGDPFDPLSYESPVFGHSHGAANYWHKDINYSGFSGRHPPLLVGDVTFSFLWNGPVISLTPPRLPRGPQKLRLTDLLHRLR